VAFHLTQDPISGSVAPALSSGNGAGCATLGVQQRCWVRRLTVTECSRLQGFPDTYLDVLFRGKPACDGPRYRALGNSMAVPVMRWIGERIAASLTRSPDGEVG
jgi:DNA (cytosine-5)-methyltransferase 1